MLPPTATIALVSPASAVTPEEVLPGKLWLESLGYRVYEPPTLYEKDRFMAGSDKSRADEFSTVWCDPAIDAIIAVRGGYGSQRILPFIDWQSIRNYHKPFFGFSDITALQLALVAQAGASSYSGFVLVGREGSNRADVEAILQGRLQPKKYIGGCLSLVCALWGTPYMPDIEGCELILEDVGEKPYCVDRMLSALELGGCFQRCSAVHFGAFTQCLSSDKSDGTIEDVLQEWQERIPQPVYRHSTYGHGAEEIIQCQL